MLSLIIFSRRIAQIVDLDVIKTRVMLDELFLVVWVRGFEDLDDFEML